MAASPPPEMLPWWRHLPPGEQRRRLREIRRLRLIAWLNRRSSQVQLAIATYLVFCLTPLLLGQPLLSLLALLPLLLLPPIVYLSYWLVWQEFHR